MGKFFSGVHSPARLGRTIKMLAAAAGVATLLTPALSFACDDDYPTSAGWAPYPVQQPVVVVDPRSQYRYDGYDRARDWYRERAARDYWHWRGRHREHEHRRHHRGDWD